MADEDWISNQNQGAGLGNFHQWPVSYLMWRNLREFKLATDTFIEIFNTYIDRSRYRFLSNCISSYELHNAIMDSCPYGPENGRPSRMRVSKKNSLDEILIHASDLFAFDRPQRHFKAEFAVPLRTSRSIPGRLAGNLYADALGDTGAKYNFMDDKYAMSNADFVIDRSHIEQITLGNGETITTTGITKTTFQFSGEEEVYPQIFHLLPNCFHKVILGNRFLRMTKTFTDPLNCLRRVVTRKISRLKPPEFFYIGGSGPVFRGLVNGRPQHALADTGAKLLIMDECYARELGLAIESGQEHCSRVLFADQTTAMTSGMVYDVSWQYGDEEGEKYMLDFHILKNAPANVILSDDFLLGKEGSAFAKYKSYMIDPDDEDDEDDGGCFAIDIDRSYVDPAIDTQEYRDHFETVRRGEEEDWIDSLSGDEQTAAQEVVELRRKQWDPTQPLTGANAWCVVPPQFRHVESPPTTFWKRLKVRLRERKSTS